MDPPNVPNPLLLEDDELDEDSVKPVAILIKIFKGIVGSIWEANCSAIFDGFEYSLDVVSCNNEDSWSTYFFGKTTSAKVTTYDLEESVYGTSPKTLTELKSSMSESLTSLPNNL